jgi:hypothetical protein
MPEYCTCGAELPPDALFCHKCGKPQREILTPEDPAVEIFAPAVAPAPPPATDEPKLTFHDRAAVRIALRVGVVATIFGLVLPFVNWLAAGFFAVFWYQRKTSRLLSLNSGVHMGWITGVVMFPMGALAFVIDAISGHWGALWQQQLKSLPGQDPVLQHQIAQFFQSPVGIAFLFLFSLGFLFLLIIGLSIAGGALGAKVAGRPS